MLCFIPPSGGMFALASTTLENRLSERYMDVARKLTDTCHESYARSETKLGPEAFRYVTRTCPLLHGSVIGVDNRNCNEIRDKFGAVIGV